MDKTYIVDYIEAGTGYFKSIRVKAPHRQYAINNAKVLLMKVTKVATKVCGAHKQPDCIA